MEDQEGTNKVEFQEGDNLIQMAIHQNDDSEFPSGDESEENQSGVDEDEYEEGELVESKQSDGDEQTDDVDPLSTNNVTKQCRYIIKEDRRSRASMEAKIKLIGVTVGIIYDTRVRPYQ